MEVWGILRFDLCVWRKLSRAETGSAGHGFYSSTLIRHNKRHGRARTASPPAFMDIIIRLETILLFYFIFFFKLHSSQNVLSPQKHEAGTIVKCCPETTLVSGLRGCRWSPCGPASRLRSARFISFLVGPFGVHQQSGIR